MDKIIFSQASIFHLQQLEFQFRKKFGMRFRLADEDSRFNLINQSSESKDLIIQRYFRNFCHELDPTLIDELIDRGIVKPSHNTGH